MDERISIFSNKIESTLFNKLVNEKQLIIEEIYEAYSSRQNAVNFIYKLLLFKIAKKSDDEKILIYIEKEEVK